MNKHIHRLVFDRRRGMRVPAAETTRSAGKAAGGQTRLAAVAGVVSLVLGSGAHAQSVSANPSSLSTMGTATRLSVSGKPLNLSATRSVSDMVSQVLASGRPNLPQLSSLYKGENQGLFNDPSYSADGLVMTLLQTSGAILVNWDSFDIGKGYTVRFDQPDGGRALNKVRGGSPSLIDGALQSNGEVMIENGAGIIFGKNARVNTGSLVATALSVAQSVQGDWSKPDNAATLNLYGQRTGAAVLGGDESATAGFVATEVGAVIQSLPGGKVLMVAPRVVNKGLIESPQGETVLAAGKTVYLFAPTDLAQRGLIVAVDNFSEATLSDIRSQVQQATQDGGLNTDATPLGTVENVREGGVATSGLVRADRGTINLVGAAIRQKGQLTATTAVKGQNGAIFLRAMKDTFLSTDKQANFRDAKTLGTVELAPGSVTEVLASAAGLVREVTQPDGSKVFVPVPQEVEATVSAEGLDDVVLRRIGVRPDEVLRAADSLTEPVRPTVPAEDASAEVKAKYQTDLARYEADKKAYDAAELTVQRSSDTFYRSRIDILGSDIAFKAGSRVQATSGEVNVLAAMDWQTSALRTVDNAAVVQDGSRIVMEAGSVIDVSGLDNLKLSSQRNQLSTQMFSVELADSPVQRGGVLYRKTVMADARKFLDLGDASGYYSNLRYTAAELSTAGGLVRMQGQGGLMLDPDARVDFSGGAVTYDAGPLISSVLLRNGVITLAGNARRDVVYDTFISDPTKTDEDELARHGLSGLAMSATSNLPGQFVGKSAGVALLGAPVQSIGAVLDGSVRMSQVQRNATQMAGRDPGLSTMLQPSDNLKPVWSGLDELSAKDRTVKLPSLLTGGSPHLFASLRPTAGLLVVGREVGQDTIERALSNLVSSVRVSGLAQVAPRVSAGLSKADWQALLDQVGTTTQLSTGQLQQAGLAGLSLYADQLQFGQVGADTPALQLAAGGEFLAKVRTGDLSVHGSVVVPGGSITLRAQGGDLILASGSRLDAGGTRRDERLSGGAAAAPALQGGSVSLQANHDVVLKEGSEVDVSGAAWRGSDGDLVKGRAGTITLQVNEGATGASETTPEGQLVMPGTITGHDFTGGGTLDIRGVAAAVLGGEQDGAFTLSEGLYADRGFGTVKVTALGDVDVLAGTQVRPVLSNMIAVSSAYAYHSGITHTLGTLQAGERSAVNLSLTAQTAPSALVQNGLPTGASLSVGKGAMLDLGLGGGITLQAGGSIDLSGALKALGGKVALTLLGQRGVTSETDVEAYGHLSGQAIRLRDGSSIDVSGAVKAVEKRSAMAVLSGLPSPLVGEVLEGGTVTLGGEPGAAVRGQLLMESGATIKLNGATARLSRDGTGQPTQVSSSAGTLSIMSTDGFSLLGNIEAKAPDASVAGGTLNVVLSREGSIDKPPAESDGGHAYPSGDEAGLRTIRITDSLTSAKAVDADRRFGEGVMSAGLVNSSGFDRVSLRADESVQLNAGVSLRADEGRNRLQSVVLDAPVIELTSRSRTVTKVVPGRDGQPASTKVVVEDDVAQAAARSEPDHVIQAHHVAMGPVTRLASSLSEATPASERVLSGDRWLRVQAGLIELNGDTAVQGAQRVDLSATLGRTAATTLDRLNGEVRFIGQRPLHAAVDADRSLKGQFSFEGQLNITAGQVYATTLSDFTVRGGEGSSLNLLAPAGGSTSQTPLSALASLKLKASDVSIDGTVRQPIGTIEVSADTLTLGDRAVLSVSADGVTVPVGTTVNKTRWVYSPQGEVTGGVPAETNLVQDLTDRVIRKQITLNGDTISLSNTSAIEAQAGGDIVAWQFNAGVGGSTDTYTREGVFAVLPNYGYDFAPHDSEIRSRTQQSGTDLKVGDQVSITTSNGVLAAGTYTLLDARYGILPGAVLVSATSLDVSRAMPVAVKNDDGSVIVSGYRTSTGTSHNGGNNVRQALLLEPEATFRAKSDVSVSSINAFQQERAARTGTSVPRPGDGGRVSLNAAEQAFDWQARFNLRGDGKFKAGEFDLAMPDIVVTRQPSSAGARTQVAVLDADGQAVVDAQGMAQQREAGLVNMDQLEQLGADSILLGGVRTTHADGRVTVTRKAGVVAFEAVLDEQGQAVAGAANTLSLAGELTAVGTERVSVASGLTIASTGQDSGEARRYEVQGDGALLQVSHRAATTVVVQDASADSQARLDLSGQNIALRGQAVQVDSTGRTALAESLVIDSQSVGLGAGSMVLGDADQVPKGALQVEGALLDRLNQAQRLNLRASTGSLAIAGGTVLGSDNTRQITLDAPSLQGVAATGATADQAALAVTRVVANEVVLRNGSGVAAVDAEQGVGTLRIEAKPVMTDGRTGGITIEASGVEGQRWAHANTELVSQGDIVFRGAGTTSAQGGVTLEAARVTASANASQRLVAGGDVVIQSPASGRSLNESLGAGGRLSLEGRTLRQEGTIDIEAGRLHLLARGDGGSPTESLVFAEQSVTSVAGRLHQVSDTYAVASGGGQIVAEARNGAIVVDGKLSAAAPTLPADVSGEATTAGRITLKATGENGAVLVGQSGRLDVSAAAGHAGAVSVDTASLGQTPAAQQAASGNAALAQTGLDQLVQASRNADGSGLASLQVRQRGGDLALNSQVKAAMVALTADTGKLTLGNQAKVDATTASGGVVQLQAGQDLVLNDGAAIEARSTRVGANGGDVLLASSDGTVTLGAATVVTDSAGDPLDGRIVIRAGQSADGRMNVAQLAGSAPATLQAGRVQLEGVRVYDSAQLTSLGTAAASSTHLNFASLVTAANTFASEANQSAILAQAGLSQTANTSVRAGVEIRAAQDFTILSDLQMAASARPMNLTVRAAGDLTVNGSVSAGLNGVTTTSTVQAGEGASLRFVAGADLASANVNATQASSDPGHFTLASGKLIRTTTGSIDVHASGDVRLMASNAASPSAIYVTGGKSDLDATKQVFAVENTTGSKNAANNAYPVASTVFTERGERLTVSAGGDVGSFESVTTNASGVTTAKVAQQVLQATGNYFVHGGALGALNAQGQPFTSGNVPVAWFSRFNDFRQGLGSFGGGNIEVRAGGDVSNLAVVAPTNARSVLNVDAAGAVQSRELKVLNGGDVRVTADGDIRGGVYFLGRGEGRLSAGGGVLAGEDKLGQDEKGVKNPAVSTRLYEPGAMLGLIDGHWEVTAKDDVLVSHVFNPTALPFAPQASGQGLTNTRASVYFTYADDAGVSLQSLQGDVRLAPDSQNLRLLLGQFSPTQRLSDDMAKAAAQLALVLPPVVSAVSLAGNVAFDGSGHFNSDVTDASNGKQGVSLFVAPSSRSDVNVYAGQDLVLRTQLQLLDSQQLALWPTVDAPSNFTAPSTNLGDRDLSDLVAQLLVDSNPKLKAYAYSSGATNELESNPIADLGQSTNDHLVRLHAGRDVVFSDIEDVTMLDTGASGTRTVTSYLRTPRPTEIVAGRDVINPNFVGQNFDAADTTRISAGRDIQGIDVLTQAGNSRVMAVSGPGAFVVEAGRDLNLNQMDGVLAIGNKVNKALGEVSAKITVSAGAAKSVDLAQLRARHGDTPGLRAALNEALVASGLLPSGGGAWSDLSDDEAVAAFGQLSQARQVEVVQGFLDATFAARYLPEDAGRSPAYYRSSEFQRKKQEAMWAQIQQAADAAKAIAVSTNDAEEARRKLRRQALFDAAEAVADLAGHGRTFVSEGDVNLGSSRVHNLGQGGGNTLGQADSSQGGIDVLSAGQVVAGLPTPADQPGGFINYAGGSFRSISLGDFLAADQKVIAIGRGDLLIYSVAGSIDSGKGSNTSVASAVPLRVFNPLTERVETVGQPPTSGSGFQKIQTPADYTPVIGLYAPNGEIRALDAFIKGDANIDIVAPAVKGSDNIAGASGVAAGSAPTVSISLTPKAVDTAAGTKELSAEASAKAKSASGSVLTVDLLGFGEAAQAAGAATAAGEGAPARAEGEKEDDEKRRKR